MYLHENLTVKNSKRCSSLIPSKACANISGPLINMPCFHLILKRIHEVLFNFPKVAGLFLSLHLHV